MKKGGVKELEAEFKKKSKLVAMLAPCFVAQFDYPQIITQLRDLGFDKVVELTFAAKIVNHEYHKILMESKGLLISTVCPGVVETIKKQMPEYENNLVRVYSPMVVMGKICKKIYPQHKTVFVSPCNFKKTEAETADEVDMVIDMTELENLLQKNKIAPRETKKRPQFDKFYNDYTKVYPIAGGLSKTAHIRQVLKCDEAACIDGIERVKEFLKNPDKKIRFLDANFCIGSCIGGPLLTKSRTLEEKKKRVLDYIELAKKEKIPEGEKGILKEAGGIKITF